MHIFIILNSVLFYSFILKILLLLKVHLIRIRPEVLSTVIRNTFGFTFQDTFAVVNNWFLTQDYFINWGARTASVKNWAPDDKTLDVAELMEHHKMMSFAASLPLHQPTFWAAHSLRQFLELSKRVKWAVLKPRLNLHLFSLIFFFSLNFFL